MKTVCVCIVVVCQNFEYKNLLDAFLHPPYYNVI